MSPIPESFNEISALSSSWTCLLAGGGWHLEYLGRQKVQIWVKGPRQGGHQWNISKPPFPAVPPAPLVLCGWQVYNASVKDSRHRNHRVLPEGAWTCIRQRWEVVKNGPSSAMMPSEHRGNSLVYENILCRRMENQAKGLFGKKQLPLGSTRRDGTRWSFLFGQPCFVPVETWWQIE